MSDIVVGGLIGIGGAMVGAIIAAFSSYIITRLQINARRDELSQQQKYNEQQARIGRLVKVRENVLLPLMEVMSKWVECSHQQVNMNVRLKKALKKYDDADRKLEIREFNDVLERGKQLSLQLNILRGQLSDRNLDDLIKALVDKQLEIDIARMPIVEFFNNPESADSSTIESAMQKDESLRKEIRSRVLQVNKRIEQLLSGESSN